MTGPVTGTITTKLKGASLYDGRYGDYTQNCDNLDNQGNQTFDVGDYVIPPQVCYLEHPKALVKSHRGRNRGHEGQIIKTNHHMPKGMIETQSQLHSLC